MQLGQGFPEWTELGQDSGLDPLGMQRPIEVIYQSLIPGISTITLRYRYYSFFPLILRHYEKHVRHADPEVFRRFQRRCEALFALICAHGQLELGITGSNWASRMLSEATAQGGDGVLDFTVGADPNAEENLRYLRNKGGAFGAIYATQMSEMGLIHFPQSGQANPNPICSDIALKLAEAVASELGTTADAFFALVESGQVAVSSLKSFEAMKPSMLKAGSHEHGLLRDVLLGKSESPRDTNMMRRDTLQMLLRFTDRIGTMPHADQVKWHWFENAPSFKEPNSQQVAQLWFLYQACDLLRLAYESILSAALTLLESAPRRRMSLSDIVSELTSYVETSEDQTWEAFSQGLMTEAAAFSAHQTTEVMLESVKTGEISAQVQHAVSLIGILAGMAPDAASLMAQALDGADYFQSLRTETRFLDGIASKPADAVIAELIRERVLKRHLWVASRKFRNQRAYTFHMEPEDGVLRYRSHFGVSPSSPRIEQALRFLRDISLIDENGVTPIGRAEMAAA